MSEVIPGYPDRLVLLVHKALPVRPVRQVSLDQLVTQVPPARKEQMVSLDPRVVRDPLDKKVTPVKQGQPALAAAQALRVQKAARVQLDPPVLLALQDLKGLMEKRVKWEL